MERVKFMQVWKVAQKNKKKLPKYFWDIIHFQFPDKIIGQLSKEKSKTLEVWGIFKTKDICSRH